MIQMEGEFTTNGGEDKEVPMMRKLLKAKGRRARLES